MGCIEKTLKIAAKKSRSLHELLVETKNAAVTVHFKHCVQLGTVYSLGLPVSNIVGKSTQLFATLLLCKLSNRGIGANI